jgi:hypothetical protein
LKTVNRHHDTGFQSSQASPGKSLNLSCQQNHPENAAHQAWPCASSQGRRPDKALAIRARELLAPDDRPIETAGISVYRKPADPGFCGFPPGALAQMRVQSRLLRNGRHPGLQSRIEPRRATRIVSPDNGPSTLPLDAGFPFNGYAGR